MVRQWQGLLLKRKFLTMDNLPKHKLQTATQKLREQLSYEKIIKLPQYKSLTKEQHNLLVNSIESICFLLLESYIRGTNI